ARSRSVRSAREDPAARGHDPDRRTKRAARARPCGPRLCSGDGSRHALRPVPGACPRQPRSRAILGPGLCVSETSAFERLFSALHSERTKSAIVFEGKSFTFGDLDDLSRRYADGLARAGLRRGDRIAVFAETRPEIVVALLGHYRLGAIHVPINDRYRGEEAAHVLRDSGARALLVTEGSPADKESAELTWQGERPRRILLGRRGAKPDSPDLVFEDLLASSPIDANGFAPADSDTAVLVYTSGTTGRSKGVALSFRALVENVLSQTGLWGFSPRDRLALALPLFHVHGLCLGIHGALLHGMTTLLFERFEARRIIDAFASGGRAVVSGRATLSLQSSGGTAARSGEGLGSFRGAAVPLRKRRVVVGRLHGVRAGDRPPDFGAVRHERDALHAFQPL